MFNCKKVYRASAVLLILFYAAVSIAAASSDIIVKKPKNDTLKAALAGKYVIDIDMQNRLIDIEVEEALKNSGIMLPEGNIQSDKDIFNVLLLVTDINALENDRGSDDMIKLCSLNLKSGEVKLISFERDIYVPIPGRELDLLSHAYAYEDAALSVSLIEHLFLIKIDAYAQVDFESIPPIIDLLGGVDLELTDVEAQALNREIETNAWTESAVHEGWNHLNGKAVLAYCRLRFNDDDWKHQERQRNSLRACKKQLQELGNFKKVAVLREIFSMFNSNIDMGDISKLILHATSLVNGSVNNLQVPDSNHFEDVISCDFVYETTRISNFIFQTN